MTDENGNLSFLGQTIKVRDQSGRVRKPCRSELTKGAVGRVLFLRWRQLFLRQEIADHRAHLRGGRYVAKRSQQIRADRRAEARIRMWLR